MSFTGEAKACLAWKLLKKALGKIPEKMKVCDRNAKQNYTVPSRHDGRRNGETRDEASTTNNADVHFTTCVRFAIQGYVPTCLEAPDNVHSRQLFPFQVVGRCLTKNELPYETKIAAVRPPVAERRERDIATFCLYRVTSCTFIVRN